VTTYPGQSKYQIVIERLEPAGVGALMALLEERRRKLAAEGLFGEERKRALPYLPRTIGVVTSPTGAVIRDILHRLDDRFPSHVVVWPVRVQGETCADEVAAAIRGFNAGVDGVPRPDVLIVARGGGSLEDLWGFNEEAVVRAVAESAVPVISAVGHETDITLVDHAADRRAPTPTAAAEMAVPVRAELITRVDGLDGRLFAATTKSIAQLARDLAGLARLLPRPEDLYSNQRRTLDDLCGRLDRGLVTDAAARRTRFDGIAARYTAVSPDRLLQRRGEDLAALSARADRAIAVNMRRLGDGAARATAGLSPSRLRETIARSGKVFADVSRRLDTALPAALGRRHERLAAAGNLLEAYSYRSVLERGFALVTDDNQKPVRSRKEAPPGRALNVRFHDGDVSVVSGGPARGARKRRELPPESQDTLF